MKRFVVVAILPLLMAAAPGIPPRSPQPPPGNELTIHIEPSFSELAKSHPAFDPSTFASTIFTAAPRAGTVYGNITLPPAAASRPAAPLGLKLGTPAPLFNGKDLTGWQWHPSVETLKVGDIWTVKDGVLHCAATRVTGYVDTQKEYENFVLTVEYRHLTNANGGIFICIHGEPKVWPDSVQIQGKFGNVGDLLNQNTGMKKMTTDPARTKVVNKDVVASRITPARGENAEMPMKQWNTLVITMDKGSLSVTNNGILLNAATEVSPASGKIGIQAEGAEMEFRKIELAPIEM